MNRRAFFTALGVVALAPHITIARPARQYTDALEILSPDDISQHFTYVPKPVFSVEGNAVVVRTYFTKSFAYGDTYYFSDGSVNEHERNKLRAEAIPYIRRWFSYYQHVHQGKRVLGPFVHSVRLSDSYCCDPDNRRIYPVMMRVAKLVI